MSILSIAAALVVANLTPVVVTSASWTGEVWDHGEVRTLSCSDDGIFKTRGAGRLLGGGLLATDLDSVAALNGMTVTNDGENPHPAPDVTATSPDTYQNLFDVSVLSAIELPVLEGVTERFLSSVLTLTPDPGPGDNIGAINQYAHASDTGVSQGASGVGNDSGVILNGESDGLPGLGTIKLSTLVQNLTGQAISDVVAGVTDLQLEIGAVASRAEFDACKTAWTDDIDSNLTREYAIAGLDAGIDAPVIVGDLTNTLSGKLSSALGGLQNSLKGLDEDTNVLGALTSGVTSLLGGLLSGLGLGEIGLDILSIEYDAAAAVEPWLGKRISDPAGVATLDLASGHVQVDLAALLGEAYSGQRFDGAPGFGLNDLAPNTKLVVNTKVTDALALALGRALDGWVQDVVGEVESSILGARIKATVSVDLKVLLKVAGITLTVDGTLQELLDGKPATKTEIDLLGGSCNFLTQLLCDVGGIADALTAGIGKTLGNAIKPALLNPNGLVPTLGTTLTTSLAVAMDPVSDALEALFLGLNGLISLRANVQNDPTAGRDPDPAPVLTYPDWEDAESPLMVPDDQYDIAALSIGVLNVVGTTGNVNLELARSSVGVSCVVGGVWDNDGRCDR